MPLRSWVVSTIGQACSVEVVEQVQHLVTGGDVDARSRLVHQDQVGPAEQGAGDEHTLLLATAQLADVAIGVGADAEPIEHLVDLEPLGVAPPRQPPAAGARHQHALADRDREAPVDGLDLRHVTDPQAVADARPCRDGTHRAEQRPQQRGLARARRSDDAGELPAIDAQIDVDEHRLAAVSAGQPVDAHQLVGAERGVAE